MKSKKEIEQLAEKKYPYIDCSRKSDIEYTNNMRRLFCIIYTEGYTQCQEDMVKESILFANFLKADFEMEDSESNEDIVWRLCGTRQTYTTDEIYDEFIKSRSLINSLNKQD